MQRFVPVLKKDNVDLDLISLLNTLMASCKEISFRLHQGELAGILGSTLDENIQGETQKKLDVISNDLIKDTLLDSDLVRAIASEEEDTIVAGHDGGRYLICFDPLDGSSNIDINSLVGTIFSIMEVPAGMTGASEEMFLQPGHQQVAAGYVLYGPSTQLVLTTGNGVRQYTLDNTIGEFLLTNEKMTISEDTQEFAINMSNQRFWQPAMQNYISDLLDGDTGTRDKNFNMRWIAAMVGDVHRVLTRGGIFTYPTDTKNPKQPHKLRLMYEANPMSFLVEQAGGVSSTGYERIMEIQPSEIHQRVAVILGSKNEVNTCLSYHK